MQVNIINLSFRIGANTVDDASVGFAVGLNVLRQHHCKDCCFHVNLFSIGTIASVLLDTVCQIILLLFESCELGMP